MIIDSAMTFEEATQDNPALASAPEYIRKHLRLLAVRYRSYDGGVHQGQIVVHSHIASRVKQIFASLLAARFPIAKVIPIAYEKYQWSDDASMWDDNSSAYNYRVIVGTDKLSFHAYGLAIDINPLVNPYIKGSIVQPPGAHYDSHVPGTLTPNSVAVRIFKNHGFDWGGDWFAARGCVDYQHFAFLHYSVDATEYLKKNNLL